MGSSGAKNLGSGPVLQVEGPMLTSAALGPRIRHFLKLMSNRESVFQICFKIDR